MAETRKFSIHQDMIFSIIFAQAGTLGKALLELVMNSIDAGGSEIRIDLGPRSLTVGDDGRGFQSRREIEEWFETFGTPHEEGDATYGRFRMGRGQIMAFAATRWRTQSFFMDVDVKNKGLDYILKDGLDVKPGCHVEGELYDELLPSDLASVVREITELARYAQIPVILNGAQINKLPQDEKWDLETEDAYLRLRDTGGLKVYNLGVFVREYSGHQFGTGGVVVSKRQLGVNFARNDVLVSKCEVWKRLRKFIQGESTQRTASKARLTDQERENLINQFCCGELSYDQVKGLKLLTDTQGKHHPLERMASLTEFTVAPEQGSRLAETVQTRKLCFVLSPRTVSRFGCDSPEQLMKLLRELTLYSWNASCSVIDPRYRPFDEFRVLLNDGYEMLEDKTLTPQERMVLSAIRRGHADVTFYAQRCGYEVGRARDIRAGVSDTAVAWTDGKRYIVLNRDLLKVANQGITGFMEIASILVHEYLHREADTSSHEHDMEFYEAYHDILSSPGHNVIAESARKMMNEYLRSLRKKGKKVNSYQLKDEDRDAELQQYEPIPATA